MQFKIMLICNTKFSPDWHNPIHWHILKVVHYIWCYCSDLSGHGNRIRRLLDGSVHRSLFKHFGRVAQQKILLLFPPILLFPPMHGSMTSSYWLRRTEPNWPLIWWRRSSTPSTQPMPSKPNDEGVRILGYTFRNDLGWSTHIKKISDSAISTFLQTW